VQTGSDRRVNRILNGEKPADLPVQAPNRLAAAITITFTRKCLISPFGQEARPSLPRVSE
jgi:hypothetical protein